MSKRVSGESTMSSDQMDISPSTTPSKPSKSPRCTSFQQTWVTRFNSLIKEGDIPGYAHCIPCVKDIKIDTKGASAIAAHFLADVHIENVRLSKNTSIQKMIDNNSVHTHSDDFMKCFEGMMHPRLTAIYICFYLQRHLYLEWSSLATVSVQWTGLVR